MSMFVPEKLRDIINSWLLKSSERENEHGGIFFGNYTELITFLPIPNFSETPRTEFKKANASNFFVREFSKMTGLKPIAGMHTHPNGSIPSEQDKIYIKTSECPFEIVISDHGSKFEWFCFDKNLKHVNIYFRNCEMEKSLLLISQSFGLTDFGRVMITPNYEILCENPMGKAFLTLDSDAMKINNWFEKNTHWNRTKSQIRKDTGLSMNRINVALKKLGRENLQ